MATASELQAIKNANPDMDIAGLDSAVGLLTPVSSLTPAATLAGTPGIYYDASTRVMVIYHDGITLDGYDLRGLTVMVQADDVTIRNSAFDATSGTYALRVYSGFANAVIDHCSLDGLKLDRGFEDFLVAEGVNTTITNSTFVNAPNDGIYIEN